MFTLSKMNRRLLPLYIATFFQHLVFFYAIEKLYVRSLGISDGQIGLMVAGMTVLILLLEIPSGIISDRWSRKGAYVLAILAFIASTITLGASTGLIAVAVSWGLWGVHSAMYSGVVEAIIYDTLIDEGESTEQYEKFFGRSDAIASAALVAGSLGSSVLVNYISLRNTYWATLPFLFISLAAIYFFKEPTHHKHQQESDLLVHTKQTIKEIVKNSRLYWLLASIFASAVIGTLLLEYSALWWIELDIDTPLYGPFSALVLSTFGIAGLLAQYAKTRNRVLLLALSALAFGIGLLSQNIVILVASQTLVLVCSLTLDLLLEKRLQDNLSSAVRSGASSVVSTLAKGVILPAVILFGTISENEGTFTAAYLVPIAAITLIATLLFTLKTTKTTQGPAS